jgi:hypothetical protein
MKYLITIICLTFFAAAPVFAFPSLVPEICRGEALVTAGNCDLTAVETAIANIAQMILGVSGSLALLAFVVGGFIFIFAGGKQDLVKKGTDMLKYAAMGLAIILLSGAAMKLLLEKLTGVS